MFLENLKVNIFFYFVAKWGRISQRCLCVFFFFFFKFIQSAFFSLGLNYTHFVVFLSLISLRNFCNLLYFVLLSFCSLSFTGKAKAIQHFYFFFSFSFFYKRSLCVCQSYQAKSSKEFLATKKKQQFLLKRFYSYSQHSLNLTEARTCLCRYL